MSEDSIGMAGIVLYTLIGLVALIIAPPVGIIAIGFVVMLIIASRFSSGND